MENENQKNIEQKIILIDKKELTITGIQKIISLKPEIIQLSTSLGGLIIIGQNLELNKLDDSTGTAIIIGIVNEIKFTKINSTKSILRKLFK